MGRIDRCVPCLLFLCLLRGCSSNGSSWGALGVSAAGVLLAFPCVYTGRCRWICCHLSRNSALRCRCCFVSGCAFACCPGTVGLLCGAASHPCNRFASGSLSRMRNGAVRGRSLLRCLPHVWVPGKERGRQSKHHAESSEAEDHPNRIERKNAHDDSATMRVQVAFFRLAAQGQRGE